MSTSPILLTPDDEQAIADALDKIVDENEKKNMEVPYEVIITESYTDIARCLR